MSIQFTSHNVELTPALRSYAEEKCLKLEKHFENVMSIHLSFNIEKLNQIAEASVHFNKAELHAKAESEDMYAAIDKLADMLHRQLVKQKEKVKNHRE